MKLKIITQISENMYDAKINAIPYRIYRIKPRLFRVEKDKKFFFNIVAFNIDKVAEIICKMDYDDNKTKGKHLQDFALNIKVEKDINTPKITIEEDKTLN